MGIVFFSNHSNLLHQFGVTNSETEQKPWEEPSKRLLTPPFLSFDAASTCCVVTEKLLFSVTSLYRRYKSFYNYHIPFESINHTAITKFTSHSVSQSLWIKPTQTCIFLSFQNQVCPPHTQIMDGSKIVSWCLYFPIFLENIYWHLFIPDYILFDVSIACYK